MTTNNSAPSINEVSTLDATTTSNVNPTPNNETMNTQPIEVILPSYRPYPMPAELRQEGYAPCDEYGYITLGSTMWGVPSLTYGILATGRDTAPWPVKLPNNLKELLELVKVQGCSYQVSETWTTHCVYSGEVLKVKEYVMGTYDQIEWNGEHWVCLGHKYNVDGTLAPYDQPSVFRSADNITIVTNVTVIPPVVIEEPVVEVATEAIEEVIPEVTTPSPVTTAKTKKSRFSFLFQPITFPGTKKEAEVEVEPVTTAYVVNSAVAAVAATIMLLAPVQIGLLFSPIFNAVDHLDRIATTK